MQTRGPCAEPAADSDNLRAVVWHGSAVFRDLSGRGDVAHRVGASKVARTSKRDGLGSNLVCIFSQSSREPH